MAVLEVREHPILFKAEMIRAILAGLKTVTRRVITDRNTQGNYKASELLLTDARTFVDGGPSPIGNPGPYLHAYVNAPFIEEKRGWERGDCEDTIMDRLYPRWFKGDHLWVKETWQCVEMNDGADGVLYRADATFRPIENTREAADLWLEQYEEKNRWKPSIFMNRWASRITLEITEVRIQRVQEISDEDAKAEGVDACERTWVHPMKIEQDYRCAFSHLWDSINGKKPGHSWEDNPWVIATTFKMAD